MKISSKLNELKPTDLNCNVFDVYSYDGLSMQDLLCQFFTKINECIKVSNETIDLTSWLVDEGLEQEVVEKIVLWLNDGTFENLINVDLFNTLHTKIGNINSQLEQIKVRKISSNMLDTSTNEDKIQMVNLSNEVLEVIKNPEKSLGSLANGGVCYNADINGDPQIYPNDAKKNVMNTKPIVLSNGKIIRIKTNYPVEYLVYNYNNGSPIGLTKSHWTLYTEGMDIPVLPSATEINITIHKQDGTDILESDYVEIFQGGRNIQQVINEKSITRSEIADRTLTDDQCKQIWGYFIGKDVVVYDSINNTVKFKNNINIVVDRKEALYIDSIPTINLNDFNGDLVYLYVNRDNNQVYASSFKSDEFKNSNICLLLSFYDGVVNGLDLSSVKIIDEKSLPTFTVKSHWQGKKANFIGDSITIGSWGGLNGNDWHNISRPYPVILGELLGLDTIRNYGVGGTHISGAFNGTDSPSIDAISKRFLNMDDDADLIVVAGGTNDYGHTDTAPFGTISDTTDISFYGALNVMCRGLVEKYLGKTIVFMTPIHRYNDTNVNLTTNKTLKDYCNAIKEVCDLYGIKVIDNFSDLGFSANVTSFVNSYMEDGLHPNPDGHELIAKRLYPIFNSIG